MIAMVVLYSNRIAIKGMSVLNCLMKEEAVVEHVVQNAGSWDAAPRRFAADRGLHLFWGKGPDRDF